MNILAMDTSNRAASVAVISEREILGEMTVNVRRNHSIQLMPMIDTLMKQVQMNLEGLDAIAVAEGPGSYTGLRIAVTTAKTLAWADHLKLIPVSSLKVLAAGGTISEPGIIIPMFDARRSNVYTGAYQYQSGGDLIQLEVDTHIALEQWLDYLHNHYDQPMQIVSDMTFSTEIVEFLKKNQIQQVPYSHRIPRAGHLGLLALDSQAVSVYEFTPKYLRLAEAEANWYADHPDTSEENWVEKI